MDSDLTRAAANCSWTRAGSATYWQVRDTSTLRSQPGWECRVCSHSIGLKEIVPVRLDCVLGCKSSKRIQGGEPFESDLLWRLPGEKSIGKDRISEILALVNTTEKTILREFSIRLFVSVSVLGSQLKSVGSRTGAVFRRSSLACCSPFPLGVPQ